MSYLKLINKIKEYDKITIFRHTKPDGDCTFSSIALYHFIKDNFKNKQVKICGKEEFDIFDIKHKVTDKFITESLAICVDVSNVERVDDFKFAAARYVIKIDHHPPLDNFGDLNIVEPNAGAAAELLAKIFFSSAFKGYIVSQKVCKYLYYGILTDTINFKTSNTTADTLKIASKLVDLGKFNPSDCSVLMFNKSLDTFKKNNELLNYFKNEGHFGWIEMNQKDLKKVGYSSNEAKVNIDMIGSIKELNIWAFVVQNDEGTWDISIRSKRKYIINILTNKYHGGGHKNATGSRGLSRKELDNFIKDLIKESNK